MPITIDKKLFKRLAKKHATPSEEWLHYWEKILYSDYGLSENQKGGICGLIDGATNDK